VLLFIVITVYRNSDKTELFWLLSYLLYPVIFEILVVISGYTCGYWSVINCCSTVIICPIDIAYSMGQIIKLVCRCQCICVVCAHSHGRISWSIFTKIGRCKNPQKYKRVRWVRHRTTPSPILHFRPRGAENLCRY